MPAGVFHLTPDLYPFRLALDRKCLVVSARISSASCGFVLDLALLRGCDLIQLLHFVRPHVAYEYDQLRLPTEQEGTDLPRGHSHSLDVFHTSSEAPTSAVCRVEKIPED